MLNMVDASPSPSVVAIPMSRRTRKRFTNVQLTMLENLFHQNSHPSREDREALARAGGMEIKSVTIWFQNKRQTERKSAASNSGHANSFNEHNVHPNITSTIHTFSLHSNELPSTSPVSPRPSLDRVASRSELRTPSSHNQTHNRAHSPRRLAPAHPSSMHHQRQLYDHLPSSPLFPTSPPTPLARDFIEFGKSSANAKTRRTLEWACEAARIADKDKERERDKGRDTLRNSEAVREGSCCTVVNPACHRHHIHHAHQNSHQNAPYASADAFAANRSSTSSSSRGRSLTRERSYHAQQGRHTHRKADSAHETTQRKLARPTSSLTLRGQTSRDVQGDMTDTEEEEEHHEAITPPSNQWSTRLTKTSTNTSLASSSSASTPSTSTSISREGSTASTNTSFTSVNSVEDDAMFKAALALCGLGRVHGQSQNSIPRPIQRGV